MVAWNVAQSVVENISNVSALDRVGCIWTSVVPVRFHCISVDVICVDAFETGGFEANAKAANATEQVDKRGCHNPRRSYLSGRRMESIASNITCAENVCSFKHSF